MPTTLRMQLVGANPQPRVVGLEELPGKVNHLLGNDPKKWRTAIPHYSKVKYEGIYAGIDLIFYGNHRQLEFDFVIAPGADPKTIQLAFKGADRLTLDAQGELVLQTAGGEIRLQKPLVYQKVGTVKKAVPGRYVLKDTHRVGFEVAAYDGSRPVVIDPVLVFSTYLGGSSGDGGTGIAVDAAGHAYVVGGTGSPDFPIAPGAFDPGCGTDGNCNTTCGPFGCGNPGDVFVAKLSADGSALIYSTYLGGSSNDSPGAVPRIAVDAAGHAYVTGTTQSPDFPTTAGAFERTFRGGGWEAFVTKLSPDGSALVYSTFLGGSSGDFGNGIAVDAAGHAYVAGQTGSKDFPATPGAFQPTCNASFDFGCNDAFVTKLSPDGSALVYSTFLGGGEFDNGTGIAVDAAGHAYVTGWTNSGGSRVIPLPNFPTTVNALQRDLNESFGLCCRLDAFVTKLSPDGSTLVYSTYLGGGLGDSGHHIAVDAAGHAYVAGRTSSPDFPTTAGAFQAACPGCGEFRGGAAFVAKLNADGSALVYSTFLGSDGVETEGIAVDAAGHAYAAGWGGGSIPTVDPLPQSSGRGFVTKLSPDGSALVYSTRLGGNVFGIAVDAAGNAYVTGNTNSRDFPVTAGAFDTECGTDGNCNTICGPFGCNSLFDAFVTKIGAVNNSPVADAGPDQVVLAGAGCTATVTLNSTGSSDPDGDPLTFTWTGPFGTASGPTPTVSLPLGTHSITLTVDDGRGGTASDTVVVTVQDATPPVLSNVPGPMTVAETSLAGTPVTVPLPTATDNCGSVVITSNAPALFPLGTTTVTFTATDAPGNTATATTTVTVVETPGRMHGEGHIDAGGKRHFFEFRLRDRATGEEGGQLRFRVREHRPGRDREDDEEGDGSRHRVNRFVYTTIAPVIFSNDPTITPGRRPQPTVDTVEFAGIGRWNGQPGYTFEARATDAGEPGRGRDAFAITIRDPSGSPVITVTGTLSGGNIQSNRLRR